MEKQFELFAVNTLLPTLFDLADAMDGKTYTLAFPSWVYGGSISENAQFVCSQWPDLITGCLANLPYMPILEIGLCFFEAQACLAYTNEDLPLSLAAFPCTWHVHLPLDLPLYTHPKISRSHIKESVDICRGLLQKCDFLEPVSAVIHPPSLESSNFGKESSACDAMEYFIELWMKYGFATEYLLLENQPGNDFASLLQISSHYGTGLCFDFAHLYMGTANAEKVTPSVKKFASKSRLWHINAPGSELNGHAPLSALTPAEQIGYAALFELLPNMPNPPCIMLELFNWKHIQESLPLLKQLIDYSN